MKFIVGLGNPGKQYDRTRHNLGADIVTRVSEKINCPLDRSSMGAEWGRAQYNGESLLLARPVTYMNLSGQAVAELANYFKIDPEDILIVVDDWNIALGKLRFRSQGSAGGHNGLKSIIERLGTQSFHRLRVGIDSPPEKMGVTGFVLGRFTAEEQDIIGPTIEKASEAVLAWCTQDLEKVMQDFNA